jgi:hypothetical protein
MSSDCSFDSVECALSSAHAIGLLSGRSAWLLLSTTTDDCVPLYTVFDEQSIQLYECPTLLTLHLKYAAAHTTAKVRRYYSLKLSIKGVQAGGQGSRPLVVETITLF